MNSFLRWAGSKKQLIPHILAYCNAGHSRYIEPFVGSAQLFFAQHQIDYSILGDKNHHLIQMYERIQQRPRQVYDILKNMSNSEADYYRIRAMNPNKLGVNQRAARFIYLNWLCFNGLYRTNKNDVFNVPYSGNVSKKMDNWELIINASIKLQSATLIQGDFEAVVIENMCDNCFVYLDPPYALENERIFTQYVNHTFGLKDIDRLVSLLDLICSSNSTFLLSYADTPEIRNKFSNWNIRAVEVQRNIAGFHHHRKRSGEILVSNLELA